MNRGNILIAGGSGLIGTHLSSYLTQRGFEVRILTRNNKPCEQHSHFFIWKPEEMFIDPDAMKDLSAVINLAGAGIAEKRWSKERKKVLLDSRIKSIECLKSNLENPETKPVIIAASAIGYYGDRGEEWLYEDSAPGDGYLSALTMQWERKSFELRDLAEKLVVIRIGIVLSSRGGALKKLRSSTGIGLYNYFGNGKAFYSWIHIDDLCEIFYQSLINSNYRGIMNGVAPHAVSNKSLIKTLKKVENGNGVITSVPTIAIKMLLGEMSSVVLDSTRVKPEALTKLGHQFIFPDLEDALEDIIKRKI